MPRVDDFLNALVLGGIDAKMGDISLTFRPFHIIPIKDSNHYFFLYQVFLSMSSIITVLPQ